MKRIVALAASLCVIAACTSAPRETAAEHAARVEQYRTDRVERLVAEDGWLTLIGLHWLEQGPNSFGSGPDNAIVLDVPGVPATAGLLHYDGETVRLVAEEGVEPTIDDQVATDRVLHDDTHESTDVVHLGRITFYVIARNDRHGLRVKDPEARTRTEFAGVDFYPIDERWRIRATFEPYDEPRSVVVETAVGTTAEMTTPGRVRFEHEGQMVTLEPYADSADEPELWFIFKDRTNGTATYGAGRYLYAERNGSGVDLDFNKAYNPPCAFTPFATCPLPPRGNWLEIAVEAGERHAAGSH